MKFYKNINELVESLTKDIITDKYEIEEFDDSYINQLEAIYNSSYFKPCKKAIIDQFISLLNDEDNIKNLLLPKILIDKNITIIYNGVFKEQNHDYEDLLKDKEWMAQLDWNYYREMKKKLEQEKQKLENANKKTKKLDNTSRDVVKILDNLKSPLLDKNNKLISNENIDNIKIILKT